MLSRWPRKCWYAILVHTVSLRALVVVEVAVPGSCCTECTWTVEVHTRRSTLLEVNDKLIVNVCST